MGSLLFRLALPPPTPEYKVHNRTSTSSSLIDSLMKKRSSRKSLKMIDGINITCWNSRNPKDVCPTGLPDLVSLYSNLCPLYHANYLLKSQRLGLPWWHSDWESACQCRGHGFEPWSGKIPHAAEQLDPWATTTEPVRLEPVLRNKRGRDSERPTHRDEEWPPLAAIRESPCTETKTQHSHK